VGLGFVQPGMSAFLPPEGISIAGRDAAAVITFWLTATSVDPCHSRDVGWSDIARFSHSLASKVFLRRTPQRRPFVERQLQDPVWTQWHPNLLPAATAVHHGRMAATTITGSSWGDP